MSVNFANKAYFKAWFKNDMTDDEAEGIMRIFYSYAC